MVLFIFKNQKLKYYIFKLRNKNLMLYNYNINTKPQTIEFKI